MAQRQQHFIMRVSFSWGKWPIKCISGGVGSNVCAFATEGLFAHLAHKTAHFPFRNLTWNGVKKPARARRGGGKLPFIVRSRMGSGGRADPYPPFVCQERKALSALLFPLLLLFCRDIQISQLPKSRKQGRPALDVLCGGVFETAGKIILSLSSSYSYQSHTHTLKRSEYIIYSLSFETA